MPGAKEEGAIQYRQAPYKQQILTETTARVLDPEYLPQKCKIESCLDQHYQEAGNQIGVYLNR